MTPRSKLLRRGVRALGAAVVVLGGLAFGLARWLDSEYRAPGPASAAVRIEVPPGMSVRSALRRLQGQGAVRDAGAVQWYLRLHGEQPRVQTGTYEIPPHASPEAIIRLFVEGKVVLEQLTVVEGSTFADFVSLLEHEPDVQHTLAGKSPAQIMAAIGHPGEKGEGRFFPDTYRFAANTSDAAILEVAYQAMQHALAAAWSARTPGLPLDSPYQALILASLVEKEAHLKSERARIAGVFVTRLRRGMRLQSDPTVIYGLGARYDGEIHTRDLVADSPYNTYTRAGLPPTPIALPGRESLAAAVQPDETGDLYFVATGLGDGAHQFSRTLQEHNLNVKTYLDRLRNPPHPLSPSADAPPSQVPPSQVAPVKVPRAVKGGPKS
jgi:UPF0755 protein